MQLLLCALSVVFFHHCHGSYVALVPTEFHPGWTTHVSVSVSGAGTPTTIVGRIKSTDSTSNADYSQTITISSGETKMLEIAVPENAPDGVYKLHIDGTGGLTIRNSTDIKFNPLNRLTFIQTDKTIYKAGQTIKFRVLSVDKDLIPQRMSYSVELANPKGSKLAIFNTEMPKHVFEGQYTLVEFPDLGEWSLTAKTETGDALHTLSFKVDEYVLPKAEVTAVPTPGYLISGSTNTDVKLDLTAKYTYGKGLMGDYVITIEGSGTTYTGSITDSSGMKSITLPLAAEMDRIGSYGTISMKVEVTDETERTYETKASVRIESQPVKITIDESRSELVYRTGMGLHIVAKITDPDDKPLDPTLLGKYSEVSLSLTDNTNAENSESQRFTLATGQTEVVWDVPAIASTAEQLTLKADLLDSTYSSGSTYVKKFRTLGDKSLRIQSPFETLEVGKQFRFSVQTSGMNDFSSIFYLVVSRGNIQASGSVVAGQETVLTVSTDMCPKGRLLVYGITSVTSDMTPEVIADSRELKLTHCQDKTVSPTLARNTQRTGTNATINIAVSWADSTKNQPVGSHDVYMLGVDKSILLLEGDNDINLIKPAAVEEELEQFNLPEIQNNPSWRMRRSIAPWPQTNSPSTGQLLQGIGLEILSDMSMTQAEPLIYWREDMIMFKGNERADGAAEGQAPPPVNAGSGAGGAVAPVKTVRKDFSDTWLFERVTTDQYGMQQLVKKLPDSITSWVISGFAIRDNSELAVTDTPYELQAFNPFFVTLNLPYSIRRGERFELRATVFNYLSEDRKVKISLTPTSDFEIRGEKMFEIDVKDGNAASSVFIIVANKVGTITLSVQAESAPHIDVVIKTLIVRPEGIERMRAITFPVILTTEQPEFEQDVMLDFSPWTLADVVSDSRRAMVTVTADMMGNALDNMENLLRVPTGCGEQNMITTVPNIFALKYLTAINDIPSGFEEKALEHISRGYQRETGDYRWSNGGYSAFGKSDDNPSTWLTAFVLRSFSQAKEFIGSKHPEYNEMLSTAVQYLLSTQGSDGSFRENGRVIHTEMTGGSAGGEGLSVYVTICLLEAKKLQVPVDAGSLSKAVAYVRTVYNNRKNNPKDKLYLAALLSYAMALDNTIVPGGAEMLLNGINVQDVAPWLKTEEEEEKPSPPVVMPYYHRKPPGPSDIEITAYVLLAYNELNKFDVGRDIVLWLQGQQNSDGGFSSTQDTVMALQAISEYAASFRVSDQSATVSVQALEPSGQAEKTYTINSNNALLLRYIELPDETNKVRLRVTGNMNSLAVVKVVWYFYTAPGTKEPPTNGGSVDLTKITLTTATKKLRAGFHEVRTCFRPEAGFSNSNTMMYLELQKPSGCMMEDLEQARKDNSIVVRLEEKDDVVQMYMNELTDNCVTVNLEEVVPVENRQPGNAILMAYYDPDTKAEVKVEIEDSALICEGNSCKPCPNGDCTSSATTPTSLGRLALAACVCLLLSLVLSV